MSSLSKLIRNENMKIYRRPRTWAMIGFLLLAIGLMSGLMKWDAGNDGETDWRQQLTQQNDKLQQELQAHPDDNEHLENAIKLNAYYLDHDIDPNRLTMWTYVNNSASLIILVTILTVIVAADMIAMEFSWGTVKLLLVGPASRTKIMAAKYIATLGYALLLLVISFAAAFAAGGILEGFGALSEPHVTIANGVVHEGSMIANALQKYGFAVVSLLLYVTMAFMISAAFRSSSMAIAFSLLFIFLGNSLSELLRGYEWVKYLLFSNIDLTQYMEGSSPLRPEMTLSFSILMLVAYYAVFQLVAWLLFTRRDVAA
ncbi:ABC transporter permease [Paenibacillus sp. MWE-103]|uniref:ABC transporter permease n=1 Tax=Paenibacillus artemisiicola TaxID=1172618 RepID=A0ABS3WCZ6_9BACL|nr:ABC transporter permease [Paenibacillus artemisiicola]MBO7746182.1 ABC transporter permease [Paenibacillus artemisiicola]